MPEQYIQEKDLSPYTVVQSQYANSSASREYYAIVAIGRLAI